MHWISCLSIIQIQMKNNINCKHRLGNNPTMSVKLTAYRKMLVNSLLVSFYSHISLNGVSGKASV